MKKLLFVLTLSISVSAHSQSISNIVPSFRTGYFLSYDEDYIYLSYNKSTGLISENSSDLHIKGDTICLIIQALKYQNETQERWFKEFDIRCAAEEILNLMTVDGRITNWRKWNLAVKKYQQIKNKQQ